MADVVIVYGTGCPNVELARERVRQALARAGAAGTWRELERDDPSTPAAWRDLASPSVLVDGNDVAPSERGHSACRLYSDADGGLDRAPSIDAIVAALARR